MRELLLIGIGTGNPDHVTVEAVGALNRAEVFFVVDKGSQKSGLLDLRDEILRRHVTDPSGYRVVVVPDPPRDRDPATGEAYLDAVEGWHDARARLFADAVATELGEDGVGAFLVWGDPSLYDSTLRVLDRMRAVGDVPFDHRVIAGVTSIQALTTAHRLPLNRIGEPITITPARQLTDDATNTVVMLDSGFRPATMPGLDGADVFWGAYLGSSDEVLISGTLPDVAPEIERRKAELREHHGWIMDTYLVRRPSP